MDEAAKKTVLRMVSYGLYVVGVRRGEEVNAFTGSWFTQTSFEPPLVAVAVKKGSTSHDMLKESGVFSVNVLESGQKELAANFFRPVHRVGNKFGNIEFSLGRTGCPILNNALGYLECQVVATVEEGDHSLFVGRVLEAGLHRQGEPLTLRETGWSYGG